MGFPIPGRQHPAVEEKPRVETITVTVCEKCQQQASTAIHIGRRPPPLNLRDIPDSDEFAGVFARIQRIIARTEARYPGLVPLHSRGIDFTPTSVHRR